MSGKELTVDGKPLSTLRVVDLKDELEKRGLSKSGSKKDLAERLKVHLQIEKHREGASRDEEQLPNISMQEKLAEQNPFIRDYFASQAELFHSQKVVKKLYEDSKSVSESDEKAKTGLLANLTSDNSESPKLDKEISTSQIENSMSLGTETTISANSGQPQIQESVKLLPKPSEDKSVKPLAEKVEEPSNKDLQAPSKKSEEIIISSVPENRDNSSVGSNKIESDNKSMLSESDLKNKKEQVDNSEQLLPNREKDNQISVKDKPLHDSPSPGSDVQKNAEETPKVVLKSKSPVNDVLLDPTSLISSSRQRSFRKLEEPSSKDVQAPSKNSEEIIISSVPETRGNSSFGSEKKENDNKSLLSESDIKNKKELVDNSEQLPPNMEKDNQISGKDKPLHDSPSPGSDMQKNAEETPEFGLKSKSPVNDVILDPTSLISSSSSTRKFSQGDDAIEKTALNIDKNLNEKQIASEERFERHHMKRSLRVDTPDRPKRKRSSTTPESIKSAVNEDSEEKDENDKAELELHVNTTEMDIDEDVPRQAAQDSTVKANKIEKQEQESSKLTERSRRFQLSRDKFQPKKRQARSNSSSSIESRSPNVVTSRQVSVRTEEMDDEALDYGDEEKSKSEPEKYNWSLRIMRLKSKQIMRSKEKKWRKDPTKKLNILMDNENYQKLYIDVTPVAKNELKLEEKSPTRVERKIEIIRKVSVDVEDKELPTNLNTVDNKPIIRKVSIVPLVDGNDKEPTPPRNPPTQLIVVTNLVRPFTLPQLKDLLQRTGKIVDIWVDKIKSKCIAKFETEAQALETRSVLHGIKWPNSNSKPLQVDFSTEDSFVDQKAKELGESKPIVEKPDVAQNHPVREWDMGKRSRSRSPSRGRRRSRSTSRDRKRGRRSHSPHRRRHSRTPTQERKGRGADTKDAEPIGKALDELFRKTVATPSIYWLPLTPQQIAEKEDLRRRRMQERERRLAELSKLRPR